jgi:co-chaperonin GroES (HSP10)
MKIQMENGYIAVRYDKEEVTKSGIFIPDTAGNESEDEISICTVVLTGEKSRYKPGDQVMFSKMITENVFIEENGKKQELFILKESDIKAVIK